ncbi:ASCH domain-containing protein [Photobacterium galatheae]|uniref:ASCH domain-containing protein n=1 Tax=Photobacterium galatheae TaxID=1654360 RepID=A0A066S0Y1_9GAMM|nr:ASCH domain-containing protein [Photobacterium galatheae]KDM93283.1 hypothetical protein EA58_01335 [Photobacterium galatheae]
MKAFSVVSPWGEKIASGQKTLEIRSWQPETLPMKNIALVQNEIRLTQKGQTDPNGAVVAIVDIVGCKPWIQSESRQAGCDESEFVAGYVAWELGNVRKLNQPVKAMAKRKFYSLSASEVKAVAACEMEASATPKVNNLNR